MISHPHGQVLVAGHRGYPALYPENTLLSFEKAAALGVDMLEMDLHLTRDRHLVVIHDARVDRTTNGTGAVKDMTLEAMLALDAGVRKGAEFTGHRMPTFEAFLTWVAPQGHLLLNVEIKTPELEAVDRAVEALTRHGLFERSVMASFDADVVRYAHRCYGIHTQGFPAQRMDHVRPGDEAHFHSVGIAMNDLTPGLCRQYEDQGIEPWCYCPDTEEAVEQAVACGVRLMTCNDPAPALAYLRRMGLHR